MQVALGKKYVSSPIASTDLHAGGLLFGIVFIRILRFFDNEKVVLTKEVVDPFRPMDHADVARINEFRTEGTFFENNRNYIECRFSEINQVFIGTSTNHSGKIVFHCIDQRLARTWGEVYEISST